MEKEPITISGLQNLKKELEDLKNVQRPKIVEAIAEARSMRLKKIRISCCKRTTSFNQPRNCY